MVSSNPYTLQAPPVDLAKRPLPLVQAGGPWYRIHRAALGALYFGKAKAYRFDDPKQAYGVMYSGESFGCAFLETFGRVPQSRGRVSRKDLEDRSLTKLTRSQPLKLVDLANEGLGRLRMDASIFAVADYALPQEWSRAFHEHPEGPDGLSYRSRHDPSQLCAVVFERAQRGFATQLITASLMDHGFAAELGKTLDLYEFALI
ncbi:RES family NAD+ phosphorylase [Stigmatella aurantiaca]|uniref:RES family protein n=1 Tax=Stigmatella aurantiaca (strain DW4/3-1) TaxID=378806 RepID=E3FXV9_STIAD|nr:RES family NAD+ phosphorylase [Stigmatella aurantiaca]ADO76088.1 RES family protein [Stigmatella aurantiaca DW4/3-1]